MKAKKNSKYENVLKELESYVRERQRAGEIRIPSEPALAVELGTSRMTLRKAIQALCDRDILEKTYNGTFITESLNGKKPRGSLLFIAGGYKGVIALYAIERIWHRLNVLALTNGVEANFLLINDLDDVEKRARRISEDRSDLVVWGLTGNKILDLYYSYVSAAKRPVIALTESYSGKISRIVCLDNYQAGRLAAEEIVKAGYQRPFYLQSPMHGRSYFPFEERFRGFADVLMESDIPTNGIRPDSSVFKGEEHAVAKRKILSEYRKKGYDAVFIHSDEHCDAVLKDEFAAGNIPSQLGVITIDSRGTAMRHHPPIACVSHATDGIADEVFRRLEASLAGDLEDEFEVYAKPEVINTMTLKKQ